MQCRRLAPLSASFVGLVVAVCWTGACTGDDPVLPPTTDDAAPPDAGSSSGEAAPGRACDLAKPFGAPETVTALNSPDSELAVRLSADGLKAYVASARPTTLKGVNIWLATRGSASDAFGVPTLLLGVNTDADDTSPSPSADGRELFLESRVAGVDNGSLDVFLATRADPTGDFGAPAVVPAVDGTSEDTSPYLLANSLYFTSNRVGAAAVYRTSRSGSSFGAAVPVFSDTKYDSVSPVVSDDELSLYFGSTRPDTLARGQEDIWVAHRPSAGGDFAASLTAVTELNTPSREWPTWLSPDGCTLYFISDRAKAGDLDVWRASKPR